MAFNFKSDAFIIAIGASLCLLTSCSDRELTAWNALNGSPAAYEEFHKSFPNSTRLTVLKADVTSSHSMTISLGSTGSGTAEEGPVEIDVTGHPDLHGNYTTEAAAALGIGVARNAEGYLVNDNTPLHDVELYITQINGKPRIVAAKH